MQNDKNIKIKCPICENEFDFSMEGHLVGDIIECPICGGNLEITNLEPFTVEPITTWK